VALVPVVLLTAVWALQRRLIYFPDRSTPATPAGYANVALTTDDGLRLTAWLTRPAAATDRGVTVLLAPGNAGHRGGRTPLADALTDRGFTVLLLDYRGYGGNPGRPSEDGLRRDAAAAAGYLRDHDRVVYLGESLGAAVVTRLATIHPPDGLVLRSPFESLPAVGRHHYPFLPVDRLLLDRFPVASLVGDLNVPTAVVYGDADSVIPPEQSRLVAERAGATVVVVPGADHNDAALTDGPNLVDAVVAVAVESDP
jgi:pimeloyl-ACP methyl ester carboxylesterase